MLTPPNRRIGALSLAAALGCTACAHTPPQRPVVELPGAFANQSSESGAVPDADWYRRFECSELNRLIAQAHANNFDLAAAEARVRQADAHARAAGAALLPPVGIDSNISHVRGHSGDDYAAETDWSAGLSASYEVDFWGANRASRDAGRLSAAARKADRDTLTLTTDASVVNTYFLVLSLHERSISAKSDLDAAQHMLAGVEARFREGMAGPLDVASERALVAAAELLPIELAGQEREAVVALALLVGQAPETFSIGSSNLNDIREPGLAPGIPAALIGRRPDIASAEYDLGAAHADLLRARAAFFPQISLTTTGALQNPGVNAAVTTLAGTGSSLTFAASLVQSIFDAGQRSAIRDETKAREDELLAAYKAAILSALADVENALSAIQQLDAQRAARETQVKQSELASEGAQLRFSEGAGDLLTTLDAQRTLFAAHEQQGLYRLARLQAIVALAKALGGGWSQ